MEKINEKNINLFFQINIPILLKKRKKITNMLIVAKIEKVELSYL